MKQCFPLLLLPILILLNSCSTITVHQDFDTTYNFHNLKTYSWLDKNRTVSSDTRIDNDLVKDRMIKAIETSLEAKGYTKVDKAQASFLVVWHGSIDSKLRVDTIDHYYRPYGYGARDVYDPFIRSRTTRTVVSEYDLGTLLIDILDPTEQKLIWRGTGQGVVHGDQEPAKITKSINNAVQEILSQFPPTVAQ